jgi:N-acetylornithine carbamoyltransferase
VVDPLHVIGPTDLPDADREAVLARAAELKASDPHPTPNRLRVGALYFNPSLRTRVSFEQAVRLVGGACQTLDASRDTWAMELDPDAVMDGSTVENIAEAARVLGKFFHVLGVRSFRGSAPWTIERTEPVIRRVAAYAGVPVVSLEGTTHHPCQALADHLTLRESFGTDLRELPIALTWAWHPKMLPMAVPHSFLTEAALAGCDLRVVHPPGYELDSEVMATAKREAEARGGRVRVFHDRAEGLANTAAVYVKSWGPIDGKGATDPGLRDWLVDDAALAVAPAAKVMHCLPVRRNVVVSGNVLDGPRSLVVEQAANRMWAQAALVEHLARRSGVIS